MGSSQQHRRNMWSNKALFMDHWSGLAQRGIITRINCRRTQKKSVCALSLLPVLTGEPITDRGPLAIPRSLSDLT